MTPFSFVVQRLPCPTVKARPRVSYSLYHASEAKPFFPLNNADENPVSEVMITLLLECCVPSCNLQGAYSFHIREARLKRNALHISSPAFVATTRTAPSTRDQYTDVTHAVHMVINPGRNSRGKAQQKPRSPPSFFLAACWRH